MMDQLAMSPNEVSPNGEERSGGIVCTVFSPRGGAGKTMLAVNIAVVLAQLRPDRVALLDLSLIFGHCALTLNLEQRASLASLHPADLAQLDREKMSRYLAPHTSTLKVLSGSIRPEEGEGV